MQQRIDHLEYLIKRLIAQRQELPPNNVVCSQDGPKPENRFTTPTVTSDASDLARSAGTTVTDGVHSVYKGADGWYDVLQEVSRCFFSLSLSFSGFPSFSFSFQLLAHNFASYGDIRLIQTQINKLQECWDQTQDDQKGHNVDPDLLNMVDGAGLLFGHVKQIEMFEILATLPPKSEVDKLICTFFDRENFPITVVRKSRHGYVVLATSSPSLQQSYTSLRSCARY